MPRLAEEVEAFRVALLTDKGDPARVLIEVTEMRERIAAAKQPEGPWDTKLGKGRQQEIELLTQAGTLMAGGARRDVAAGLNAGVAIGWLDDADRTCADKGLCALLAGAAGGATAE